MASPIDLIKKYAPNALTGLIKDPSKIVTTVTRITPSLETLLKTDPKSVLGTANTTTATQGASVSKKAKDALDKSYGDLKRSQAAGLRSVKSYIEKLKKKSAESSSHESQLYQKSVNTLQDKLGASQKTILANMGVVNTSQDIQKKVVSATKALSSASIVPVTPLPTGTVAQKAKAIAEQAKAQSEAAKKIQAAVKDLQAAQAKAQAIQPKLAAAASTLVKTQTDLLQSVNTVKSQLAATATKSVQTAQQTAVTTVKA